MSKHHGMSKHMWKFIKRVCTAGDVCHTKFSNLFGYLFEQGDFDEYTEQQLIDLADKMAEHPTHPTPDLETPIGFAFFGQFIDHDITLDVVSRLGQAIGNAEEIENLRTPRLDLDSVYLNGKEGSPYLYENNKLIIGNDRNGNPSDVQRNVNGTAIIGDPRNDENLFISQLQSLFIRFHNWVIDCGFDFEKAQEFVRWTYQKIVVEEFLPEIIDADILQPFLDGFRSGTLPGPIDWASNTVMPVEFSVAAFRFGHSHVRQNYRVNDQERGLLFDFGGFSPVSSNKNVDWKYFFDIDGSSFLKCRPINTKLAFELLNLPPTVIQIGQGARNLAVRNLKRGQQTFGLLSGEHIAETIFHTTPIPKHAAIKELSFHSTPLWFYILAEAELRNGRLGLVGGNIVAGTILQMLLADEESYIHKNPNFNPFDLLPRGNSITGAIAKTVG